MGTIFAVLLYHELSRLRVEPVTTLETDLIARVSHEIKTPLTGIRLALLLLLEERFGVLDKMQKTLISSASSDCERLLETVNGLLYFTNAEGKTIHLNRIPVDLRAKVEQSACRFHDIAVKKSLVIRIEGNANRFPEVLADRERLDEVLNSLLSLRAQRSYLPFQNRTLATSVYQSLITVSKFPMSARDAFSNDFTPLRGRNAKAWI
jgi:signal transduction histidine kinase